MKFSFIGKESNVNEVADFNCFLYLKVKNNVLLIIGLAILGLFVVGCSKKYYVCAITETTRFYKEKDTASYLFAIPPGKQIVTRKRKSREKYRFALYGNEKGYVHSKKFVNEIPYSAKEKRYLLFSKDSGYVYTKVVNKQKKYAESNRSTGDNKKSGGSVQVRGYYRKNGTYVKPHTRSAPSKRR